MCRHTSPSTPSLRGAVVGLAPGGVPGAPAELAVTANALSQRALGGSAEHRIAALTGADRAFVGTRDDGAHRNRSRAASAVPARTRPPSTPLANGPPAIDVSCTPDKRAPGAADADREGAVAASDGDLEELRRLVTADFPGAAGKQA